MIPHVFGNPLLSSLITGFVAAVAAYGAFITPKIFGFTYTTFGSIYPAFVALLVFNLVTVAVCYWFYVRKAASIIFWKQKIYVHWTVQQNIIHFSKLK